MTGISKANTLGKLIIVILKISAGLNLHFSTHFINPLKQQRVMAYQRITRKSLVERWNKVMRQIGHDHFCVPSSEYNIKCYKDMVYYIQIVCNGFDDDFKDGYDDKRQFYQDKAKAQRLRDWLRYAPIDDDAINELSFGVYGNK